MQHAWFLVAAASLLQAQPQQFSQFGRAPMKTDCAAEGVVVNAITGEPVARAHVMAPQTETGTATDATGHWSMSNLGCGRFTAVVTRPGFLQSALRSPVTLASGSPVHDLKIELTPQSVVVGTVTDEAGDPVMNAQITVMGSRIMQGRRTFMITSNAQSNDLGEFRIASLGAGKYIFCARSMNPFNNPSRAGMAEAESCYPGPVEGGVSSAMDLPAGRETRVDFVVRQIPAVHIRGTVVGMPKNQGAAVTLQQRGFSRGPTNARPANITPDGKFDLGGVTPGSYVLATDYWENGSRLTARVPVDVGGSDLDGIVVHLDAGLTIDGAVRVESSTGRAMPNQAWTPILRSSEPGAGGGQVKWNKERTAFTIADVTAGSYRMEGTPPPPFYIKSAVLGGRDLMREEVPVAQSGMTLDIVIADDSGSIDGAVEDADGQPVGGAFVMALQDGRLPRNYPGGPDGHFTIANLAPGDYRIYAWDDAMNVEYADAEWMKQQGGRGQNVSVGANQKATVKLVEQIVPK